MTASDNDVGDGLPDLSGVTFERQGPNGEEIPFLWGVATASHQVEGGIQHSDWVRFTEAPAIKTRVKRLARLGRVSVDIKPPGRAIDHWVPEVFAADVERARLLGMNAYRLSLEWSRIQPRAPKWAREAAGKLCDADRAPYDRARRLELEARDLAKGRPTEHHELDSTALERYVDMVDTIRAAGMEPIVTLNHMSLPRWVSEPPTRSRFGILGAHPGDTSYRASLRGWAGPVTPAAFERFVRLVAPPFKDKVKYWLTVNEPVGSVVGVGYLGGIWPPGFLADGERARRVYLGLIEAHVLAYDAIKEIVGPGAQVGFGHIIQFGDAAPQSWLSRLVLGSSRAVRDQWHYSFNQCFLDAVTFGHYNPSLRRKDAPSIKPEWQDKLDFVGTQYYRSADIRPNPIMALRAPWANGWTQGTKIYPGGLYRLLREFHDRYGLPFLVTENGMGEGEDCNRAAYTIAHLQQLGRAVREGIDVIGYLHWTIADNWEWALGYLAEGRFGLFGIDRHADMRLVPQDTFPRHITEGALAIQYLISNCLRIGARGNEDPFDAAVERFGTYSGDGAAVSPPSRSPGVLWEASVEEALPDAWGQRFTLYLSPLPGNEWIGMAFLETIRRWVRLEEIIVSPGKAETGGALRFALAHPTAGRISCAAGSDPASRHLEGEADIDGRQVRWRAHPVVADGTWRSAGSFPPLIALHALEADYDRWRGRVFGSPTDGWSAAAVTWPDDGRLTLEIGTGSLPLHPGSSRLVGNFTSRGVGAPSWPWSATRLPDDVGL